jgi:hypothetical protein
LVSAFSASSSPAPSLNTSRYTFNTGLAIYCYTPTFYLLWLAFLLKVSGAFVENQLC